MRRLNVLLLVLCLGFVSATDYYVNATSGNDSLAGTSPALAWKTIAKINGESFSPGDNVYFERGQVWREQFVASSNGTNSSPITYSAYGEGRRPEITALNVVSSKQDVLAIGDGEVTYNFYDANFDPSFEVPGYASWEDISEGTNDVSFQSDVAYSGSNALLFEKNENGSCSQYTNLSLLPEMYYEFTVRYRGDVGSVIEFKLKNDTRYLSSVSNLSVLYNWTDVESNFFEVAVDEADVWKQANVTMAYASDIGTASFYISVRNSSSYPKSIYIDDVMIYPRWTPHENVSDVYGLHWVGSRMTYMMVNDSEISKASSSNLSLLDDLEWVEYTDDDVAWLRDDSGNPDTSGDTVELSLRTNAVTVSNVHGVVLDNLIVTGCGNNGGGSLRLEDYSNNVTVQNSLVQLGASKVISSEDSCHHNTIINNEVRWGAYWGIDGNDYYLIKNNTVYQIGYFERYLMDGHCVGMEQGDHAIIEDNNCYSNGRYTQKPSMSFYNTTNVTVRYNFLHDNYRGGIILAGGSTGAKIYNNIIANNGVTNFSRGEDWANNGMFFDGSTANTSNEVYNNIVFNHNLFREDSSILALSGVMYSTSVAASEARLHFSNNILFDNHLEENDKRYEFFATGLGDASSVIFLDNIIFRNAGLLTNLINMMNTDYYDYNDISDYSSSSLFIDPLLVNSSGYMNVSTDFQLQYNSPAIDAGVDVNLTTDFAGNPIYGTPDIGAYEYQPPYNISTDYVEFNGTIRVYSDGKFRYLNRSGGFDVGNKSFSLVPSSGYAPHTSTQTRNASYDVEFLNWTASLVRFNVTNLSTGGAVDFVVCNLTASTSYGLSVDSVFDSSATSDVSGCVDFSYSGGWSEHEFSIEPYTAPVVVAADSGGSGGGGSGSPVSSSSPFLSDNVDVSKYWENINGSGDFVISRDDFPVRRVRFDLSENVENVGLQIYKKDIKPLGLEDPEGEVYDYLSFVFENLSEDLVSNASVEFVIEKSWMQAYDLDVEDVVLLRYNYGWRVLNTDYWKSDMEYFYFKALTPGFSYFAIVAGKGIVEEGFVEEGLEESVEGGFDWWVWVLLGIVLLSVLLSGAYLCFRKNCFGSKVRKEEGDYVRVSSKGDPLEDYVRKCLRMGFGMEEIREVLLKNEYETKDVERVCGVGHVNL